MNGIQYWEYKKYGQQTGVFNNETEDHPATANFITNRRNRSEYAEGSDWKGPGTLWIAESEESLRKK